MGRSYLYPGSDTEHLSPQQRQLEALYDQVDRPDHRLTPQQFFKSPEYGQFVDQQYGSLSSQVPPGSQIVNQDPFSITYRDAQGYETTISRGNADSPGSVTTETNRPAIIPNTQQQDFTNQVQQQLQQGFTQGPQTIAQLDPQTAAQLQVISAAEQAKNAQAAQDTEGQLVAQLYGNRVNQSSIANDAAARFAQLQGLVGQQQQSDAANRMLALQQFLTQLQAAQKQANQQNLTSLYGNLTGQNTQTAIANAGLGLDAQKLAEQAKEFNASNYLQGLQVQNQQEQLDAQNGPFNAFLKTLQAASGLASGVGGGLSAFSALTRPAQGAGTLTGVTYG